MPPITYLAAPYSKGDASVRLARFEAVTQVAAKLIEQKEIVYSPLTMTHPIDLVLAKDGDTLGSEFWVEFDRAFMDCCSKISVLLLPGWNESSGVAREIAYFAARGISPTYLEPRAFSIAPEVERFRAAF